MNGVIKPHEYVAHINKKNVYIRSTHITVALALSTTKDLCRESSSSSSLDMKRNSNSRIAKLLLECAYVCAFVYFLDYITFQESDARISPGCVGKSHDFLTMGLD